MTEIELPAEATLLIRFPNWLGDLVMALPTLSDLRVHLPSARLIGLVRSPLDQVLVTETALDRVIAYRQPKGFLKGIYNSDLQDQLKSEEIDLALLLTNSLSSAIEVWQAGIPLRVGYRGHRRSLLLNHPRTLNTSPSRHQVDLYRDLLRPLGVSPTASPPKLSPKPAASERVLSRLNAMDIPPARPLVGINPGAAYGSAKCWLPERFAETINRLRAEGIACVLFGTDEMRKLNEAIMQQCSACNASAPLIDLTAQTPLDEFIAWVERCDLLLTNDSGPMHVAAAVGTPPLALFGSTSSEKTSPYGLGQIIHKHVSCSPCYLRECPIDFRCMRQITVDEVVEGIHRLLARLQLIDRDGDGKYFKKQTPID